MQDTGRIAKFRGLKRKIEGISLIELLIAMMLFFVIVGAIYGIWLRLEKTYAFTNEDLLAQQQARSAMGEMVEYIRTARTPENPPSEALNGAIVYADTTVLRLWTDTDRADDHGLELVQFRVDENAKVLYRDAASDTYTFPGTSVRLVSTNVANDATTNPLFTYFDSTGTQLATPVAAPSDIREVHITLRVDVVEGSSPTTHVLTSIVQPRNLRQY